LIQIIVMNAGWLFLRRAGRALSSFVKDEAATRA
jgi:hypothetical protein